MHPSCRDCKVQRNGHILEPLSQTILLRAMLLPSEIPVPFKSLRYSILKTVHRDKDLSPNKIPYSFMVYES